MKVYFVRHGETEFNRQNTKHQPEDTPLSGIGKKQARHLAKRFTSVKVTKILTSPLTRAKETAEILANELTLPLVVRDDLVERKNPAIFAGKAYNDPELRTIKQIMYKNYDNPSFRYADEETYFDMRLRAEEVLVSFEEEKEDILVVTHGHFLTMVLGLIILGDALGPKAYEHLDHKMHMNNTGITVVKYQNNSWRLGTFNDVTHLSAL